MINVPKNLSLVAKDSMIDFQTYANIFAYEKTPFDIIQSSERAGMPFPWLEDRFDGFMLPQERLINNDPAANMFASKLHSRLITGYKPSDLVIAANMVFLADFDQTSDIWNPCVSRLQVTCHGCR
jgi:hypothetical protein